MSCGFLTLTSASQAAPTATSESVLPTATRPPAKKATPTTRSTVQPTKEPVILPPRSTQTSLPQPTPQLAEKGPWLLISTSSGLWAANPDGSGLKQLTQQAIVVPRALNSGVSPSNNQFAFILSNGQDQLHGLTLHLLALPGGEDKTITALTSKSTELGPSESVGDGNFNAARAMAEFDSLAWSPDGSMLAFIGAQQGTSADVYPYIPKSSLINHLPSGPSQAYAPSWSPDGKYIVHFGANTFGTGTGFSMQGAWAVRASDGQVYTLYMPQSSGENLLGWISPTTFVVYSWSQPCGGKLLRTVNILNQKSVVLYAGECIQSAALDPQSGSVLFAGADTIGRSGYGAEGRLLAACRAEYPPAGL